MATTSSPSSNHVSSHSQAESDPEHLVDDAVNYLREYAREQPETLAQCGVFGIGFILGWKLKPW